MKLIFKYSSKTPQVLRKVRCAELSEVELQCMLDHLDPSQNALQATARELMDYADGRGELTLRVELAGDQAKVVSLVNALAETVHYSDTTGRLVEQGVVEEGDEDSFRYVAFKTVLD
jgi:hypothetical protein